MNRRRVSGLAVLILTAGCQAILLADGPAAVEPRDALVLVAMRSFMGRFAGGGFVIGDGTLVVTAYHLVFEQSKQGRHEMAGTVFVASPYLGDAAEARFVAGDEELDLAVLGVPWKGHPAVKLADESTLLSAEKLAVTGIPQIILSLGPGGDKPVPEGLDRQTEELTVDFVAVRGKIPRFISLSEVGHLGPGWSGSPMLLPDSDIVAGCFTTLHTERGELAGARGPAVTQIRRLLEQKGCEQSLMSADSRLPRREDAMDAFMLVVQAYHHFSNSRYKRACALMDRFINLRPESSFGYTQSAILAEKQSKPDLAEQYHKKALELNPDATGSRFYYGQFLSDRQPDKALEIFQGTWKADESKPAVALLMFNILSERGQFQRSGELLNEALGLNPRNAYLHVNLGVCQFQSGKTDEAIANYAKAVELLPERGPFRGQLAHILEKAGRLDESEKHFRELLNVEPDNPVVHLWLARFLGSHRPEARAEALKEARIALDLPRRGGLTTDKIEQVIQELQAEKTPAP